MHIRWKFMWFDSALYSFCIPLISCKRVWLVLMESEYFWTIYLRMSCSLELTIYHTVFVVRNGAIQHIFFGLYINISLMLMLLSMVDSALQTCGAHTKTKWCRQCFEWNYREMNDNDIIVYPKRTHTYIHVCMWCSNNIIKEGAPFEHGFQLITMFVHGNNILFFAL